MCAGLFAALWLALPAAAAAGPPERLIETPFLTERVGSGDLPPVAERVSEEGIDVEVVDLRTLKPLDKETVLASVRKTGKLLIVHEDNITGGVGAEVAALVAEHAFEHLDGPISRLCGPDVPTMPFSQNLEDAYMPDTGKVVQALRKLAAY